MSKCHYCCCQVPEPKYDQRQSQIDSRQPWRKTNAEPPQRQSHSPPITSTTASIDGQLTQRICADFLQLTNRSSNNQCKRQPGNQAMHKFDQGGYLHRRNDAPVTPRPIRTSTSRSGNTHHSAHEQSANRSSPRLPKEGKNAGEI